MSMPQGKTGDLAEISLSNAMNHVAAGAAPWVANPKDVQRFKEAFRADFVAEITTLGQHDYWAPRIAVLFRGTGALAAVAAEARRKATGPPKVEWKDLVLGAQVVRMLCTPASSKAGPKARGKICSLVPFLQDSGSLAALLARLRPGSR